MKLQDNPFFILNLSCKAGRRDVVSAAEGMSFILNAQACSDAQNSLLNPAKRLSAELSWFLDLSAEETNGIRESIQNNRAIPTDRLSSLSKLNATLFNFQISDETDMFDIGYAILDLDEQFSRIDIEEITTLANSNRSAAKLAPVQSQTIEEEISRKRDDIRQIISERLASMNQETYVELVTMIAEKCVADTGYNDGVILSDVIDQYEVRMQSAIENSTDAIESNIECIKKLTNDDAVTGSIKLLIGQVREWDKLVQPLQLKSQASGMPHKISEQVGRQLRNLAVFLHNEKGKTQASLELVDAMKGVFVELEGLSDLFKTDSDVLKKLLHREKSMDDIMAEMDDLKKLSTSVRMFPNSSNVNTFAECVRKLDAKIKQLNTDTETRTKLRESLCYLTRGTAIELHNEKHQTAYALTIAQMAAVEFMDLPSLRDKLSADVLALKLQLNRTSTRTVEPPPEKKKKDVTGIVIGALAIALILLLALGTRNESDSSASSSSSAAKPPASYTAKPTASYTAKPSPTATTRNQTQTSAETKFSSSSNSGDKVYADIVSVFPEIGIYTEGTVNYSYFVCRCKTTSGATVWVYMTVNEYKNNIDSTASTSLFNQYADEVTYSTSKRIHGTAEKANSIMLGLSSDTGDMVINFSSIK